MLLPTKVKVPMKLPPLLDTRFVQFLQVLPADYHEQAYAFKAFARPRKIKSPLQLLQLVLAYCGLDLSLRSCAGEVAQSIPRQLSCPVGDNYGVRLSW